MEGRKIERVRKEGRKEGRKGAFNSAGVSRGLHLFDPPLYESPHPLSSQVGGHWGLASDGGTGQLRERARQARFPRRSSSGLPELTFLTERGFS